MSMVNIVRHKRPPFTFTFYIHVLKVWISMPLMKFVSSTTKHEIFSQRYSHTPIKAALPFIYTMKTIDTYHFIFQYF